MTTMIQVQGAGAGRCDARCYDAKHGTCDCVCGGRNHGVGRAQAIRNTRDLFLGEEGAKALDEAGARVQYQMDLEG